MGKSNPKNPIALALGVVRKRKPKTKNESNKVFLFILIHKQRFVAFHSFNRHHLDRRGLSIDFYVAANADVGGFGDNSAVTFVISVTKNYGSISRLKFNSGSAIVIYNLQSIYGYCFCPALGAAAVF